jgi:hypothetical protein
MCCRSLTGVLMGFARTPQIPMFVAGAKVEFVEILK